MKMNLSGYVMSRKGQIDETRVRRELLDFFRDKRITDVLIG